MRACLHRLIWQRQAQQLQGQAGGAKPYGQTGGSLKTPRVRNLHPHAATSYVVARKCPALWARLEELILRPAHAIAYLHISHVCPDSDDLACKVRSKDRMGDSERPNHLGVAGIDAHGVYTDEDLVRWQGREGAVVANDDIVVVVDN